MRTVITILILITGSATVMEEAEDTENQMTDTATVDKWKQVKVNRSRTTAGAAVRSVRTRYIIILSDNLAEVMEVIISLNVNLVGET